MMIRKPEAESTKLCTASETMARELEIKPTIILKIASRKLISINKYPDLIMVLLRFFFILNNFSTIFVIIR